jgi:hypothetical protein
MITLKSNGAQALSLDSIAVSGAAAAEFIESDTCQTPALLQPNNFCSISITFMPSSSGPRSATLSVTDNASGSPQTVQLSGTGVAPPPPAPAVTIAPNPATFSSTTQGTANGPMNIVVTNSGNASLHISSLLVGGNNPGDFTSVPSNCTGAVLVANTSCTVAITFVPVAAGQRTETITLTDDAANSPQLLVVQGTAISGPAPAVIIAPAAANFPSTTQGTSSNAINITVTNSGSAPLHISSLTIGGANAADFISPASNCSGAALAANASCTVSATFAPLATGQRTETITLTDDAANSPQIIAVQGSAGPAISVAPISTGSTAATVNAGGTAQYQLQITPAANYTGVIALACTGAPLAATCQVPASVPVSNGVPAPFSVMVMTTGTAALVSPISPGTWPAPTATPIRVLSLVAILFLSLLLAAGFLKPGACHQARATAHFGRALAFASVFSVFLAITIFAGCGGTANTSVTPPVQAVTPQGTYTITITPSAKNASGQPLQLPSIQLTLTVN